jgi:hypothetical protein
MASSRVGTCAQIRRIWSIAATKLRSGKGVQITGGYSRGYQRDLRDVGGQQTGGRLNMQPYMQPSGLNIYASQSCPENARFCRIVSVSSGGVGEPVCAGHARFAALRYVRRDRGAGGPGLVLATPLGHGSDLHRHDPR